jgi:2-polyprenyl-6-methoxyphenol hydroxylase-like FAD-dependent oxidoreductase
MVALTLAAYDVEVVLLDKREHNGQVSRSLAASTRTLELLRRFGLEDAVRSTAVDVLPCAWVTRRLLSGNGEQQPLGYPVGRHAAALSPTAALWAPQHLWEPLLLARLRTLPTVTVRMRCQVQAVSCRDDGAVVTFVDEAGRRELLRTSYVIAADGAHSLVRGSVGIAMDGADNLAEVDRIEFRADVEAAVGPLRCGLNVVTDPDAGGVLAPRSKDGRWGITRDIAGPGPRFADMDVAALVGYVRRVLGVQTIEVEIECVRTFRFAAQLATRFRSGSAFLTGDAAHRVTPRGGTGMNMAVQDGYDLGWKLGFVLSGWAHLDLLDSYEAERRPVAAHNVERSASTAGAIQTAEEALPWDLDGRIAHHWVTPERSTVDLPGLGLTLLVGPAAAPTLAAGPGPVDVHVLDRATSSALDVAPAGGVLLRPDGKEVWRWPQLHPGLDAWRHFAGITSRAQDAGRLPTQLAPGEPDLACPW